MTNKNDTDYCVMTNKNDTNYGAFGDGKERLTYPQTAPPCVGVCCDDKKVVNLPERHFIEEELDTFESWLKEADPWSLEKTHLMTIVAEVACTESIPLKHRTRASALIRSNVDDPIVATVVK